MKNNLIFFLIILTQNIFTQVKFQNHVIVDNSNSVNNPYVVFSTDIDGDNDMDILTASSDDNEIVWFENLDGKGTYGTKKIISTDIDNPKSVYAADIDGDGDMDVLSASFNDNKVAWYKNIDGKGTFGSQQIITTDGNRIQSVFADDLDGDGDIDVISASNSKIVWHENVDGKGTFGNLQTISYDVYDAKIHATDLDNDGDVDLLSASNSKIAWYKNIDGKGTFENQLIISTDIYDAEEVYAGDIDKDGDVDVLSVSQNKIAWYENIDGKGVFGSQQIITTDIDDGVSIFAIDIDGDNDLDVLSASSDDNKIAWYENIDSKGTFGSQKIINTNANFIESIYVTDIDNDGDADIISAASFEDQIAWYKNTDGKGAYIKQTPISYGIDKPLFIGTSDIDGDGNIDVFSSSSNGKIAWHKNTDGKGDFDVQQIITIWGNVQYAHAIHSADIDGDGDLDFITASGSQPNSTNESSNVTWHENLDGKGNFGFQKTITYDVIGTKSIYAADIDSDGDIDILSASYYDNKIALYENLDGKGTFGDLKIIRSNAGGASCVFAIDIDGDGDMDLLTGSSEDNEIEWHENINGLGTFGIQKIITTHANNVQSVYATDIDGDGDIDILSASYDDDKIAWYENTDGKGSFGSQQIITTETDGAISVYAADIDGDGDMDVLSASYKDNKIALYENTNGKGKFWTQQIITINAQGARSVYASDIDKDGDMDILSASFHDGKIAWYENIGNTLSVSNHNINTFSIYPNPSNNLIHIKSKTFFNSITIYDVNGRLISKKQIDTTLTAQLKINNLSKGIYLIEITSDNKKYIQKLIIK